jgi:hypothetical protein
MLLQPYIDRPVPDNPCEDQQHRTDLIGYLLGDSVVVVSIRMVHEKALDKDEEDEESCAQKVLVKKR